MNRERPAPRNADFARDIIATMERETKSKAARIGMAEYNTTRGNYDDEAKQVWREYLATLTA